MPTIIRVHVLHYCKQVLLRAILSEGDFCVRVSYWCSRGIFFIKQYYIGEVSTHMKNLIQIAKKIAAILDHTKNGNADFFHHLFENGGIVVNVVCVCR